MLRKMMDYLVELGRQHKAPIHFFRFEDMMGKPKETLEGIMKFALGVEYIEGTNVERRIADVLDLGSSACRTYKPR